MKRIVCLALTAWIFAFLLGAEEGMFPLSEIHKLDLKARGFAIAPAELYNPNGISLIDGIIDLDGCTASFVSTDGLILTNYHCAFGAIQALSTPENDYLRHGFYAAEPCAELPAKRYTVRLIESYRDVSAEVLSVLAKTMTHLQRTKAIDEKMKRLVAAVEKKRPGRRAEVAEMFRGKTYVLFVYNSIKDVRLVYAPPRSIGEFGGETDNWTWPRHTGDFAMMRAYVAPDGSNADYSPQNVPFHPRKHLRVAAAGVNSGDFAFVLGYPGSTHRHKSSHYLAFEENVRMPLNNDLYRWIIDLKEKLSATDRATAIKLSASLKGLWNAMKRNQGQLKGLRDLRLAERRRRDEAALQSFIDAAPARRQKYGSLLNDLARFYATKTLRAPRDMVLANLLNSRISMVMGHAFSICEASYERVKEDTQRKKDYMERNFANTEKRMVMALQNYYEPAEKAVLGEMLRRAAALPAADAIVAVRSLVGNDDPERAIAVFLEKAFAATPLRDPKIVSAWLKKSTAELKSLGDPFIDLAFAITPEHNELKETEDREKGILDPLLARLVDAKREFLGRDFIPDANGTLRLTYGRVRGYAPADAVLMKPFTTLGGLLEKHAAHPGNPDYDAPPKLLELAAARDHGRYAHPELGDVPVAMLYDMDTTGGNSGSPVFNARGEIVGLNFDRVYEATINDFAWDESYSRSIGVDIRFILWSLDKFSGAGRLLQEMGVK